MSDAQFPFDGFRPPSPPEELRGRVLGAVRATTTEEAAALVDRIWESSRVRLAVGTLFLMRLVLNFLIPLQTGPRTRRPAQPVKTAPEAEGIPRPDHRETVAEQLKELRWELLEDEQGQEEP